MKVQVVIPSFNRPTLVQKVIQSVQAQTLKDWKLYIMDNSSPNLWPQMNEIYKQYAESDQRLKIDHTDVPNERRVEERWHWFTLVVNKALFELSENEPYVVLSTDDDLMMPNKLEVLTKFLEAHPDASMVAGIMELITDDDSALVKYGGTDCGSGSSSIDWLQPMYRRELINKLGRLHTHEGSIPDASLFTTLAKFHNGVRGIPITLDRQYLRTKNTYHTDKWLQQASKGGIME